MGVKTVYNRLFFIEVEWLEWKINGHQGSAVVGSQNECKKRTIFCIVKFAKTQQYKKEVPYMKNMTSLPTMKVLEQITFRALQNSFSKVMAETFLKLLAFLNMLLYIHI